MAGGLGFEVFKGKIEINPLLVQVRKNHHIARSGDIYIIQEPYWFLFDKRAGKGYARLALAL
jgi:hypothetical protein